MINTDSVFRIGSTHHVCQDFATHSCVEMIDGIQAELFVGDGCSGSVNSDFGSRILCQVAKKLLYFPDASVMLTAQSFPKLVWDHSIAIIRNLELDPTALDSTLLIGIIRQNEILVHAYGDGTIVARWKAGGYTIFNLSYPSGYPQYMGYGFQYDRQKRLTALTGENPLSIVGINEAGRLEVDKLTTPFTYFFPTQLLASLTLFSDGATTFFRPGTSSTEEAEWFEDVLAMTDYKQPQGAFVERSVNAFCKKMRKQGITHSDDLAVSAFIFGEE